MVIAVVGSTGQLGSDLLSLWGDRAVGLARRDLDLVDPSTIAGPLDELDPDVVVNAAAYNQVDQAESQPADALAVNTLGPRWLARWCASARDGRGVRLIHVSTDFVFGADATREVPYTESDPTGPQGAYAVSKLGGELAVRAGCRDHLVVRTCGLYGHSARTREGGGNFVETMLRLGGERGTVRVVDDQHCTPTSTLALSRAIDSMMASDCRGVIHATCAGATTWWDFARAIFELAGLDVDVQPISTAEFGAAACRPGYSVLDGTRLVEETGLAMPGWREALEEYLAQRGV